MSPVLEAESVSVRAGTKTLLDGVVLSCRAGDTVSLVGPNGAGKTTLLRVLFGELRPRSGSVRLKGRDVAGYSPRLLAAHRAVLSQHVGVAFPFTVAEVVRMGAGDRRGSKVEHLVESALAEVDLSTFADRVITTLSGGEQQRVHFARVLVQLACGETVHGPGALLLDEPTASLDLRHQLDVLAAMKKCAARGVTVVVILHDLNLATLFSERIVVLDGGRLIGDGPPSKMITDEMLRDVFGVSAAIGRIPAAGIPFILPHAMQPLARPSIQS